ncbi:Lipocalin-like domain-containing protein [Salegentibacter echinorum]|uniref:Lipocalin-like domain-containing protein n=1 Tax=Salegentibacter echinorum TaxID=1073325 RepID=A0A1M5E6H0_SALEC|nr:lipocalin family protein [Salegentibacter echinorum]SHF74868.1 Lipocalin-like domain-containing protein [Salegentibacter echinorum]
MKNLFNLKGLCVFIGLALSLISCEAEDSEIMASNVSGTDATASITPADLEGEWILSKMNADTLVDLNNDNVGHKNILLETDCFDTMGVVFNPNGDMVTTNSKLDFKAGANNDEFKCLSGRTDTGTWRVENQNNEERLVLTMTINGNEYTHSRVLERTENTFAFEVSKMESEQYYGNPDGTDAEDVTILSLEYTRVN